VGDVQLEAGRAPQPLGELLQQLRLGLDDRPAPVADQVDVLVLVLGVARGAVAEVGVPDQSDPLHQVERPVHGGDVDGGRGPLHAGADLLRGGVPELADGVEHELPLGGHPQPALVQRRAQCGDPIGVVEPVRGVHVLDGRARAARRTVMLLQGKGRVRGVAVRLPSADDR